MKKLITDIKPKNKYKAMGIKCLFLFISLFALHTQLTAQNYKGQVFFLGHSMQEINDSLYISFDMKIESGAVSSCNTMSIVPVLSTDGIVYHHLPYILIRGNAKRQKSERAKALKKDYEYDFDKDLYLNIGFDAEPYAIVDVNKKTDTLLQYRVQIPYENWMDKTQLNIYQELTGCRNESRLFAFTMDNAVKLQSREPFQPTPLVSFITPFPESKNRKKQGQAFLDFQVGRSVIVPTYRRNPEELAKIREALQEVSSNPDVELKGLFIEGYASPEGKYETNERLSSERANALKEYMVKNFGLDEKLFRVGSVAEDWEGLAALVQSSDIDKKEQILEVITSTARYDEKESKLKRIGNGTTFRQLLKDLFPQLRRVEYQIDYTVKDYSVTEAKSLLNNRGTGPERLFSQLEMYRAAQEYDKNSEQFDYFIIDCILKYYPNDLIALNNATALTLTKKQISAAERYIKAMTDIMSDKKNHDGESISGYNREQLNIIMSSYINNIGVQTLLNGDLDAAEQIFKNAIDAGSKEAVHNLEQVRLKREDNKRQERYKK